MVAIVVENHEEAGVIWRREFKISLREQVRRLRNLLWVSIMLALYYMKHCGSFQLTFFASDLDRFYSAPHMSVHGVNL